MANPSRKQLAGPLSAMIAGGNFDKHNIIPVVAKNEAQGIVAAQKNVPAIVAKVKAQDAVAGLNRKQKRNREKRIAQAKKTQ